MVWPIMRYRAEFCDDTTITITSAAATWNTEITHEDN